VTQVLVPVMSAGGGPGPMIPLGQLASIRVTQGPRSIRTENAQLVAYVYVDMRGRDMGGFVADAARAVSDSVKLPPGYRVQWSGQYEYLQRAAAKLRIVVPATLLVIFVLLYLNFGRLTETLIVLLSVPFALVGGAWLLWWLGYNLSVTVAVGFIALAGVAAETGVVMLIYLDQALAEARERARTASRALSRADLNHAIMEGAVERVRPKMMTVTAIMAGAPPNPMERRHRLGSHAPHCCAHGGRNGLIDGADAGRHSRDLCAGQRPRCQVAAPSRRACLQARGVIRTGATR
jgi:Cu(I)/Ag(I) efflux system membrane protein CusA/SilA